MTIDRDGTEIMAQLREILDARGLHAFLGALNSRVPHRFTGIYRFEDPILRNVRLFDRENPHLEVGTDLPLREAYCSIVHREHIPFATDDARSDERIPASLAAGTTIAYCGVPLGQAGALCHFDLRARPVVKEEIPLMAALADPLLERLTRDGLFPA